MAACGLVGAGRGGGGASQSWVKPEVDPPIGCALPRDLKPGRDIVSHVPFFSREAACVQRQSWATLRGTRPVDLGVLRAERLAERLGWDSAKSSAFLSGEGAGDTSSMAKSHHGA